jgi:hypothetical protein
LSAYVVVVERLGAMIRIIEGSDSQQLEAAFRLRHEIFVLKLGWFPPTEKDVETDAFDLSTFSLGNPRPLTVEPLKP